MIDNTNNQNTLMLPYDLFGIECREGWKSLYGPLIDYVNKYNEKHSPHSYITIDQIKEKWAGLEFYWSGTNVPKDICEELDNMIRVAHNESYKMCEICGSKENIGMTVGGWYSTVCESCVTKYAHDHIIKWKIDGDVYIFNEDGKKIKQ